MTLAIMQKGNEPIWKVSMVESDKYYLANYELDKSSGKLQFKDLTLNNKILKGVFQRGTVAIYRNKIEKDKDFVRFCSEATKLPELFIQKINKAHRLTECGKIWAVREDENVKNKFFIHIDEFTLHATIDKQQMRDVSFWKDGKRLNKTYEFAWDKHHFHQLICDHLKNRNLL